MVNMGRLVETYPMPALATAASKMHALMDLERIRDSRVVPFLLKILEDPFEPENVRIYVLRQVIQGNGLLVAAQRLAVADAIGDVLSDTSTEELRLQAALALGEFTDIDGVLSQLSAVSLAQTESIELRYAAFTSLERAGPSRAGIAIMRQIASDDTLGRSAKRVLCAWHTTSSSLTSHDCAAHPPVMQRSHRLPSECFPPENALSA